MPFYERAPWPGSTGHNAEILQMSLLHVRTRPITVEEFNLMAEKGILAPDERVELIEGAIVPLSPQNKPHSDAISWTTNLLVELFGKTHLVRVQLPLDLSPYSEPEPDFAVVPKESLAKVHRHPTSANLVIEVAQTSLAYDRYEKASLYARFGIPDYWVLNTVDGCLEVHRSPKVDASAPFGHSYAERQVYVPDQTVVPCSLVPHPIRVSQLTGP